MATFFDALIDIGQQIGRGFRDHVVERGWFGDAAMPLAPAPDAVARSPGEASSPAERLGWSQPGERASPTDAGWFARHFAARSPGHGEQPERTPQNHEQERSIER